MTRLHGYRTGALAAAVVAATPFLASAQSTAPTLGSLRTPPSPAFTVLGIEPSAVERPMTPSDVALSFISKLRQGTIPKEYAFEASPYWLVSQPNLSWQSDVTRNLGESVARTTSLSIATATAETGTAAAPVTSMAVGVRTLLSSGRMTIATQRALTALEQTLSETGDLFLRMVGEAGLDTLDTRLASGEITPADYEARKQELTALVLESDAYREAMARAEDVAARREGFFLEVAAGLVWDFPGASWESRAFRRRGIWATPSYEFGPWNLVGVLRYLDEAAAGAEDAVDWGGRAIYSTADYGLSLEFVQRSPIELTDTIKRSHRVVGIAEYRISRASWVIASFGKDRQKPGTRDTLVAQLGLGFSFSKDRYF
jgi:hypothetical protein